MTVEMVFLARRTVLTKVPAAAAVLDKLVQMVVRRSLGLVEMAFLLL
jgi:hypothetical protein